MSHTRLTLIANEQSPEGPEELSVSHAPAATPITDLVPKLRLMDADEGLPPDDAA